MKAIVNPNPKIHIEYNINIKESTSFFIPPDNEECDFNRIISMIDMI